MESIKEIKDRLLRGIRFESYPKTQLGGQSVSLSSRGVTLISDEFEFSISIGHGRSKLNNMDLALTLFELYLDEVIK